MNTKDQMDQVYGNMPLDEIPWNMDSPPEMLVDLVTQEWVRPCAAVDLGCGAGNAAVWLASRGFKVTGLDISEKAVELARQLATDRGVSCEFDVADMTESLESYDDSFGFAYDWQVLHHVFPEDRPQYIANVHRMLRAGGKYLSICFSEQEPASFGGPGKYRETRIGTSLYFSSEEEMRALFESLFDIKELSTVQVEGKMGPHLAIKTLMTKRDA